MDVKTKLEWEEDDTGEVAYAEYCDAEFDPIALGVHADEVHINFPAPYTHTILLRADLEAILERMDECEEARDAAIAKGL